MLPEIFVLIKEYQWTDFKMERCCQESPTQGYRSFQPCKSRVCTAKPRDWQTDRRPRSSIAIVRTSCRQLWVRDGDMEAVKTLSAVGRQQHQYHHRQMNDVDPGLVRGGMPSPQVYIFD